MTFAFEAELHRRDFAASLEVASGETVAILGPNGSGKSTLLALIAGLLPADTGRAALDGTVLFDAGDPSVFLPPHRRGVSLLAQDALLFPHLSVLENVAFGPRSAGIAPKLARSSARTWLGEVDALDLVDRRAAFLSGGQAQRVAVARALASEPRLLLLDEPLAALDATQSPAIRATLRRVLADRSAIVVTHDVFDAYSLADRVVVMEAGRVIETGTAPEVLERPRSAFVAALAGLQLIRGARSRSGLQTDGALEIHATPSAPLGFGTRVTAALRPSSVGIWTGEPPNNVANRIRAVVSSIEPRGDLVRVTSGLISADVLPVRVAALGVEPGALVWFTFSETAAVLYAD